MLNQITISELAARLAQREVSAHEALRNALRQANGLFIGTKIVE